jgi:hypothetical protein
MDDTNYLKGVNLSSKLLGNSTPEQVLHRPFTSKELIEMDFESLASSIDRSTPLDETEGIKLTELASIARMGDGAKLREWLIANFDPLIIKLNFQLD